MQSTEYNARTQKSSEKKISSKNNLLKSEFPQLQSIPSNRIKIRSGSNELIIKCDSELHRNN